MKFAYRSLPLFVFLFVFVFGSLPLQADELPHYFPPGISQIKEPAEQYEAVLRHLNSMSSCTGQSNRRLSFGDSIKKEHTIKGEKFLFVFDPWVRLANGKILFYNFCGQYEISEAQFKVVEDDFVRQAVRAMELKDKRYGDIEQRAVNAWVAGVKRRQPEAVEADLRKQLDEKVPDAPAVTFRELNFLPPKPGTVRTTPREIHIGYIRALGMAYLHSGVTYTTIQARLLDVTHGEPDITFHEFIHADPVLQNLIIGDGIDLELMASIDEMFFTHNKTDLFFHPYTEELREMLWVKFGYDFEQARDDIFKYPFDRNVRVDRAKFNEHLAKLEKIKDACREFFPKVIDEFYSRPFFWVSMHNAMGDDKGIFRIMLAIHFDSTLLGSHSETMRWAQENEPRIKRAMYDAWQKRLRDVRAEDAEQQMSGSLLQLAKRYGIDRKEAMRLAKKYNLSKEQLKGMPVELFMEILEKEREQNAPAEEVLR